jgi:outer membrane protein
MKFLRTKVKTLIVLFFFLTNAHSNEKTAYIDMNILINTSKAGVSINNQMKKLVDQNNKIYEKLEKNLVNEEKELLKKKNVVDPQQFNEEIKSFQIKIRDFKNKRKNNIDQISNQNIKAKNELVSHVTKILAEYSAQNEISLILNKESIIIGKKENDITEKILVLLNNKVKNIKVKN